LRVVGETQYSHVATYPAKEFAKHQNTCDRQNLSQLAFLLPAKMVGSVPRVNSAENEDFYVTDISSLVIWELHFTVWFAYYSI